MKPLSIIEFIASKRPEEYSLDKIKEKSTLLPRPVEGKGYSDENGLQGLWVFIDEPFKTIQTYKNGKKHGQFEVYGKNDKLFRKGFYKNGQKDGLFEEYHSITGNVFERGFYKNGEKEGVFEHYYSDGILLTRTNHKNGVRDGVFEKYNKNGQVTLRINYKNNKVDGKFEEYDNNGTLISMKIFKDDKEIKQ